MKNSLAARWILPIALAAALLPSAGCRKTEPPPAQETAPLRLDASAQIESYKEILRKDPNNLQALIGIGNLYYDTNQDAKAIEHYQKALSLDPTNSNVRTDMALLYRRTGNVDRAIEEMKKAISYNPRHPQSRYNLGVILIQDKRDLEGGARAWEGLLENVPEYPYKEQLRSEIAKLRSASQGAPEGIKYK
ncbi:MAG: tetratricopeptide repeat protein [Thermodesulfobacteriota bacterium]